MTEEEEVPDPVMTLDDVPDVFFNAETAENCVLSVLMGLPPVKDEHFESEFEKTIDLAENSIDIVTAELTSNVMESQQSIFSATDQFLFLNDKAMATSNVIQTLRLQVQSVCDKTLNPILDILTHIRDLRRDAKVLTVLHFVQSLSMIHEALNAENLIWSAYTMVYANQMLEKDDDLYSLDLYQNFIGLNFSKLPTCISPVPIELTLKQLKMTSCVQDMIREIQGFRPILTKKINTRLELCAKDFSADVYSVLVISYCLITVEPPIAKVIFDYFAGQIRQQSVEYFETQSNDMQTLFKFMDSSCGILSSFKQILEFHAGHERFGALVSELPIDIDVLLLEKLPSDRDAAERMEKITKDFRTYYGQLTHVAESNVLQFLSRLNCTNLDALSFIQLTRELKSFNEVLQCGGLADWITIAATEFLSKYSVVSTNSVRTAVQSDAWVPVYIASDFVSSVCTVPSEESVFETDPDFNPANSCASSSVVATVKILHSLVCLSLELDSNACFNLIVQVSVYYLACILNEFCSPIPFVENTILNRKLRRLFDPEFTQACKSMFKLVQFYNSLPEQKPPESRSETQLMQMTTATDGLKLIRWYLSGIRAHMEKRVSGPQAERVSLFFTSVYEKLLPNISKNLTSASAKQFLSLQKLKLQLMASNWSVDEVQFEYHREQVQTANKAFQVLAKELVTLQLSQSVCVDIWTGAWRHVCRTLISAFGSVRACNANGRSLMVGDTRAIANLFGRVSKVEADTTRILEFVNAFFYKPMEFAQWIDTAVLKFKPVHISNLVRTGLNCKLTTKDSRELLARIEAAAAKIDLV